MRRLPDGRSIFYKVENTRTDLCTAVLEDNAGQIWLTRSSGIYVLNPNRPQNFPRLETLPFAIWTRSRKFIPKSK